MFLETSWICDDGFQSVVIGLGRLQLFVRFRGRSCLPHLYRAQILLLRWMKIAWNQPPEISHFSLTFTDGVCWGFGLVVFVVDGFAGMVT